jgi:guanosine-3',5'-bis(diphosphate) 3'-pyrophosphohydrolase
MEIESLIRTVQGYCPQCDTDFLRRAYHQAEKAFKDRNTEPGWDCFRHSLLTARVLAELHLDPVTVAAALLQGLPAYGGAPLEKIAESFGEEAARLIDGISKLDRISWESLEKEKVEGLRKMFLAMADDLRVVLIKLGGQVVRMRRLAEFQETQRRKIINESMNLFAPLANRLGIWSFKRELEDLALRNSDPDAYDEIVRLLDESQASREKDIGAVVKTIRKELENEGIPAEISGRPKHIYSIYQKMKRSGRSFEEIHDVRGIRIVVRDVQDCYAALDVIHRLWKPRLEEFDDYIAHPKNRIYRSLHTTVSGPSGKPAEIQIRTPEMDQTADLGVAAHWRYKEKVESRLGVDDKIAYLRGLLDWRQDLPIQPSPKQERVYVFTPKGDVIDLPSGATPLDFAYLVHTGLGHCCRGAKVNGKLVPLDHKMQTGDRLEILTSKRPSPSRDWLNPRLGYVKTRQAKQKIGQWFRKKDGEEKVARGREVLDRELKRSGIKEKNYEAIARLVQLGGAKDLFEAVACGAVNAHQIVTKITQAAKKNGERPEPFFPTRPVPGPAGVLVKGEKDLLTRQAHCCRPLPGEKVIGYITRGRGVSIHRYDCHNVVQQKGSPRLVEVDWGNEGQRSLSSVRVVGTARKDWLKDFASIVEDEKAVISSLRIAKNKETALTTVQALLEIESIGQLNRILHKTRKLASVIEAGR